MTALELLCSHYDQDHQGNVATRCTSGQRCTGFVGRVLCGYVFFESLLLDLSYKFMLVDRGHTWVAAVKAFLGSGISQVLWWALICAIIYDVLRKILGTNKLASDVVARGNLQLLGWVFLTWWACWFQALPHAFSKLSRLFAPRLILWHCFEVETCVFCPLLYRIYQLDIIWIKWNLQQRGETHNCSRACFKSSWGLLSMFWTSWHLFLSFWWLISHLTLCWATVFKVCLPVLCLFASEPRMSTWAFCCCFYTIPNLLIFLFHGLDSSVNSPITGSV